MENVNKCTRCKKGFKNINWKVWAPRIASLVVALIILSVVLAYKSWFLTQLQNFLGWIAENPIGGPFLICIATALVVIWMCPYSILAIGSGYTLTHAYKNIWIVMAVGTFAVFIGAWVGGMIAFGIGRFCCRK